MPEKVKYLKRLKSGRWYYYPPKDAARAGVVKAQSWSDGRTARVEAIRLNKRVEEYRKGLASTEYFFENMSLAQLAANYLVSSNFRSIKSSSQKHYELTLRQILATPLDNGTFGEMKLNKITSMLCAEVYSFWTKTSVPFANNAKTIFGILANYGMAMDVLQRNPMAVVKKVKHTPRSVIWTKEQVEKALDVAFSKYSYRSVGLVILLCYEWAQRPVDIYNLTWSSIDWEEGSCTIQQKKRGATVHLPISDELEKVLYQQYTEFGYQAYVIPHMAPDKSVKTHTASSINAPFKKLLVEANLPKDLRIGDLRKTAITEMVEAGVDQTGILPVSGHKSLASLNPYMKPTLKGATSALERRKKS